MSALLILLIAVVALALGYVFYGSWLAKQWGVDPNRETPAHTAYDGKDFVPANPAVLMAPCTTSALCSPPSVTTAAPSARS